MRETRTQPSLLPYLQPEQGTFFLRLQPATPGTSDNDGTVSPFAILDDDDPLALRVQGAFFTDFGSVIKEVDVLLQRSTPYWPQEEDIPLNNSLVDACWQQTASRRRKRNRFQPMMFSSQVGKQQELLAFAPLLFCTQRHLYFEPPCPECGTELQLCKDDNKLESLGLAPYSSTLRRFLFCPSCQDRYYSYSKEDSDPALVLDCRQFIQALGSIKPETGQTKAFPCPECPQHDICFGEQQTAHKVLFPLSFYPFYLLITDRNSLEGFHSLTLLPRQRQNTIPLSPASVLDPQNSNDPAIHTILGSIVEKLEQQIKAETDMGQLAPSATAKGQSEETIITTNTSVETIQSTGEPPVAETPSSQEVDATIEETVILKPANPEASAPPLNQETLQTQTVLLAPDAVTTQTEQTTQLQTAPESPPAPRNQEDLDLAETVLLRPGEKI